MSSRTSRSGDFPAAVYFSRRSGDRRSLMLIDNLFASPAQAVDLRFSLLLSYNYNDRTGCYSSSNRFHPRSCDGGFADRKTYQDKNSFSSGTERLSSYRSCQVDLPEFRDRARVQWHLQCSNGRHQPDERGNGVRRFHHGGRALVGRRLGGQESWWRAALYLGLF